MHEIRERFVHELVHEFVHEFMPEDYVFKEKIQRKSIRSLILTKSKDYNMAKY